MSTTKQPVFDSQLTRASKWQHAVDCGEDTPLNRNDVDLCFGRFADLEYSLRISPILTTTGIEFIIVGGRPNEFLTASTLPDALKAIGEHIAAKANDYAADYFAVGK